VKVGQDVAKNNGQLKKIGPAPSFKSFEKKHQLFVSIFLKKEDVVAEKIGASGDDAFPTRQSVADVVAGVVDDVVGAVDVDAIELFVDDEKSRSGCVSPEACRTTST
jgi:hypothetical protein